MNVRVGNESSVIRAGCPTRSAATSAWLTLARTRIADGSMTSRIAEARAALPRPPAPRPSCRSSMSTSARPCRRSATRRASCSALLSACFQAFMARSRWISSARMSAASALRRRSKVRRSCSSLRARFVERQLVLFGGDGRHHLVLEHLELGALDGVLGHLELRLAVRPRGDLLAALPVDLLDEVAVFGLAVVRRLDLRLAVELDQQIAALDARPGLTRRTMTSVPGPLPDRCRLRRGTTTGWLRTGSTEPCRRSAGVAGDVGRPRRTIGERNDAARPSSRRMHHGIIDAGNDDSDGDQREKNASTL